MSFPTTNLHTGDRWSEGYKNYEWNGTNWEENEICIPDHHWKFNEVNDATYGSDSGSKPKQLTPHGLGSSFGQTGIINNAVMCDANSSDGFKSVSAEAGTVYGITIAAWFKYDAIRSRVLYGRASTNTILLYFPNGSTEIKLYFNGYNTSSINVTNVGNGDWHHVAATYYSDGTNGLTTIRIDGEIKGTSIDAHKVVSQASTININTNGMHYVGNYCYSQPNYAWYGYLEDVRVYNRDISELDIANIYNTGLGTHSQFNVPGYPTVNYPVHHWKLNEDNIESALKLSDSGSRPILLSEVNSVDQITTNSPIHTYWSYGNAYSDNTSGQPLDETYTKWTYSAFFKYIGASGDSHTHFGTLLYLNNDVNNRIYITIRQDTYSNQAYIRYMLNGTTLTYNVNQNQLYYMVITYDGSNIKLYLDSDFSPKATTSLPNETVSILTTSTLYVLQIGYYATNRLYLSDAKLWDYALSDEERENEYYLAHDQKKSL